MFTILATSPDVGHQQIGAADSVRALLAEIINGDGATEEPLVCRWRQYSVTGQLECVWRSGRIAAIPIEKDPTPVSGGLIRHQQEN